MVGIIDYGLGNLRSVAGAVEKVGYSQIISDKISDLSKASNLILPGVGAFEDGIVNLMKRNLIENLTDLVINKNVPILGICLGAQLMAKDSYEFGYNKGLGWIDASVIKIETNNECYKVPHVGWNDLFKVKESPLFNGIPHTALFYYVHSFHIKFNDDNCVIGECEYGNKFTAAFQKNNIYGTQFHPEKSQFYGLTLLKNFLDNA